MTQSSANSLVLAMTQSGKSLMNSRNRRGPRTVPCGTPLTTGALSETAPSTMLASVRQEGLNPLVGLTLYTIMVDLG